MTTLILITAFLQVANGLSREASLYSGPREYQVDSAPKDTDISLLQTSVNLETQNNFTKLMQADASAYLLGNRSELASLSGKHPSSQTWCYIPVPFDYQRSLRLLAFLGLVPSRIDGTCDVETLMERWSGPLASSDIFANSSPVEAASNLVMMQLHSGDVVQMREGMTTFAMVILIVFLVVMGYTIFEMLRGVLIRMPEDQRQKLQFATAGRYLEEEAWARGFFYWLSLQWITPWIVRWGQVNDNSDTRISPADLGELLPKEDQCTYGVEQFEKLYKAEKERVGQERVNVWRIVFRYIGWRAIAKLLALEMIMTVFHFLIPNIGLEWVVNSIVHMYQRDMKGEPTSSSELTLMTLVFIAVFCFVPVILAAANNMGTMLSMNMGMRIYSILAPGVYCKAQRLPMVQTDPKDAADSVGGSKEPPAELEGESVKEKAYRLKREMAIENNCDQEGWPIPKTWNISQLIEQDIDVDVMTLPSAIGKIVTMIPVTLVLVFMLWNSLKAALFIGCACTILGIFCIMWYGKTLMYIGLNYKYYTGERLRLFQEIMASIRVSKSMGILTPLANSLRAARAKELENMRMMRNAQGILIVFMYNVVNAPIYFSLLGYTVFYGQLNAVDLLVTMRLLNTLMEALNMLSEIGPTLIAFPMVSKRISAFFRIQEAPLAGMRSHGAVAPSWVKFDEGPDLRIQGSYSFLPNGQMPAMKNLDLRIPSGKLCVIVGKFGSGKSTLIHSILGELHPVDDARLDIPSQIAFCAQSPYTMEGTLRENILYGAEYNEERFKQVMFAASMEKDAQLLPGGIEAKIGSRGVLLSGGQRARVSMARAAYRADTNVAIFDDTFAALDGPTQRHIWQHLIQGDLLKNRTRVCVCQPDAERVRQADWVVIVKDMEIALQGKPADVMQSEHYTELLHSASLDADLDSVTTTATATTSQEQAKSGKEEKKDLRETETEGRPTAATYKYFAFHGRRGWILAMIGWIVLSTYCRQMQLTIFADWSTAGSMREIGVIGDIPQGRYLFAYAMWWIVNMILMWLSVRLGHVKFDLNIGKRVYEEIITNLMNAPVDWFYDKTPVGRIMNRMTNDLHQSEGIGESLGHAVGNACSFAMVVLYTHLSLPIAFTLAGIPYYYLLFSLCIKFWNVLVPLRYCGSVSKSKVQSCCVDVEDSIVTVRAFQSYGCMRKIAFKALDDQNKADTAAYAIMDRWISCRVFLMFGFFIASIGLSGIWLKGVFSVGSIGLCLQQIFALVLGSETYCQFASHMQRQAVALNRIHEFTDLPQERKPQVDIDCNYQSISVRVSRKSLSVLKSEVAADGIKIVRLDKTGSQVVLKQLPGEQVFVPPGGMTFADFLADQPKLKTLNPWYRITGINGAWGNAAKMAEELCKTGKGDEDEKVVFNIENGWLANGAKIEIEDLVTGYADFPLNILHGISLTIEPRQNVAFCGTTGCGKSTVMLSLLRIIEPRGGSIRICGLDTQLLSCETLRRQVGLVPQEPITFSGSLRFNLDIEGGYADERIWEALKSLNLDETLGIAETGGLDTKLSAEGDNLSVGQKQLVCIARMVLRRPMLLLMDEATSAIDPKTQEAVQKAITSHFQESTIVAIAHRIETILDFDKLFLLDRGHLVEEGVPRKLAMTEGSRFGQMVALKAR